MMPRLCSVSALIMLSMASTICFAKDWSSPEQLLTAAELTTFVDDQTDEPTSNDIIDGRLNNYFREQGSPLHGRVVEHTFVKDKEISRITLLFSDGRQIRYAYSRQMVPGGVAFKLIPGSVSEE
ncbi:MAG: hypothetical protein AB7P76_06985 [Candidatus Melainabacteria bacterium]